MKKLISVLLVMSMLLASVSILAFAEETTQPVTGMVLDKKTLTLTVGETGTLTAKIAPENATNKTVTWTSSKENVATVVNGVVTALSAGATTVVATTVDGEKKATCAVIVNDPVVNFGNITMKETYNDEVINWGDCVAVARQNLQEGDLCFSDRNKAEMVWSKVSEQYKGKDWIAPALDWKNGAGKVHQELWTNSTHYDDFYTFELYESAEVTIFTTSDTKTTIMEEKGWTYGRDTSGYLIGYTSNEISYNHKFSKYFEVADEPVVVAIPNINGVPGAVVIDYDYKPEIATVNFGNIKMKETYNDDNIEWGNFVAVGKTNLQEGDLCFSDRDNSSMIWQKVSQHLTGLDWIAPALDWKNGVGKPHANLWTDDTYYSDFYTFDLYKSAEIKIFATSDAKLDSMQEDGWTYDRDLSGYLVGFTDVVIQYNHQFTKYIEVADTPVKVCIPNVGGVPSPVVLDYAAENSGNNGGSEELEPGFHPVVGARYKSDFIDDIGVIDGKVSLRSVASIDTIYSRYIYGPLRGLKAGPGGQSGARWLSNSWSSPTSSQYHEIYYVDDSIEGYDYFTATSDSSNDYCAETLIEFELAESAEVMILSNVEDYSIAGFEKEVNETSWIKARYLNKPFAEAIRMLGVKPDYDIASTITKTNANSFVDTYYAEEYAALSAEEKAEFNAAWEAVLEAWSTNDVRELIGVPYSYNYAQTRTYNVAEGETLKVTIPGGTTNLTTRTPIIVVKPVVVVEPANTELNSISVDGVNVANFEANVYDYTVEIPATQADIPVIAYTKEDEEATVSVVNPTEFPGKAVITVSKNGEETKVYTITYEISGGLVSELEILEDNQIPEIYGGGSVTPLPQFVENGFTVGSSVYVDRPYIIDGIADSSLIGLHKIIGGMQWWNSTTPTAIAFKSEDTLPWLNFKINRDSTVMVFLSSNMADAFPKFTSYGYLLETSDSGYFTNTISDDRQKNHTYKFFKKYKAGETVTIPNVGELDNVYMVLIKEDTYESLKSGEESYVPVSVTGISIDKSEMELTLYEQETLTATITPVNATNKAIIWTSSDRTIVSVGADNGVIRANKVGSATITATTVDGTFVATCEVTVNDGSENDVVFGDANGDGEVDFADAIVVLKHDAGVATLSGDNLTAADVNQDGEVDFVDAIQILKYDSGLISSFN